MKFPVYFPDAVSKVCPVAADPASRVCPVSPADAVGPADCKGEAAGAGAADGPDERGSTMLRG